MPRSVGPEDEFVIKFSAYEQLVIEVGEKMVEGTTWVLAAVGLDAGAYSQRSYVGGQSDSRTVFFGWSQSRAWH